MHSHALTLATTCTCIWHHSSCIGHHLHPYFRHHIHPSSVFVSLLSHLIHKMKPENGAGGGGGECGLLFAANQEEHRPVQKETRPLHTCTCALSIPALRAPRHSLFKGFLPVDARALPMFPHTHTHTLSHTRTHKMQSWKRRK